MINKNDTIICKEISCGGLCNRLKNFLSCIRIKEHFNCNINLEDKKLFSLFDIPSEYYNINNYNNKFYRNSWRLCIFECDDNIDKIENNEFSKRFNDYQDSIIYKNYKYNSIDFIYDKNLFKNIYYDYSRIFKNLKIKPHIYDEYINFVEQYFIDNNIISLHLRTWINAPDRRMYFNIMKVYEIMEKYERNIPGCIFFISCDDNNIKNEIIKYQYNKNKKILYYKSNNLSDFEVAFIELLLLSHNNILIGSYISTFTELAYIINFSMKKEIIIL